MLNELTAVAATHEGLKLLLLYGSRARGETTQHSDWDFGYLATERFDPDALRVDLVLSARMIPVATHRAYVPCG